MHCARLTAAPLSLNRRALIGGALLWFAADRVTAQHLQSTVTSQTRAQS